LVKRFRTAQIPAMPNPFAASACRLLASWLWMKVVAVL
jgi:hypothetical protein